MVNINLRPWREELRAERQKQFLVFLIFLCLVAGGGAFSWFKYVDNQIKIQNNRNNYIAQQTKLLDKKIEQIKDLEEEKNRLIERMQVIQKLQGDRPLIVRSFHEFVAILPENVYFTSLKRQGTQLTAVGFADRPTSISDLLRNLNGSEWFKGATISGMTAAEGSEEEAKKFNLFVQQTTPQSDKLQEEN